MTPTESLVLPRTTVVSVAMAAAHRAKIVVGVSGVAALICLIFGVADIVGGASPDRNDAAAFSWVVIFGAIAVFAALRARRAVASARRAAGDLGATWTLVGKLVFVRDDRGQPTFDNSFKVTRAQRAAMISCLAPPNVAPDTRVQA